LKIINRERFLKLPDGVVYAKYKPMCFEEICIKGGSSEVDWAYQDLLNGKSNSSDEMGDIFPEKIIKN